LAWTAFVLLARRDPNFLSYFFVHEHVGRFLSNVTDRDRPWWYYLPILAVGTLPWTAFLPGSLRMAWHRAVGDHDGAMQLLLAWTAFVLLFFSLSGAKLPLYVLPLFPSAAMLIACVLIELPPIAVARRLLPVVVLGLAGCAVMLVLAHTHVLEGTKSAYAALCNPLAISFAILAAGSGAGVVLARRSRVDTALAVVALGALLFVQGLLFAYGRLAPTASAQPLAALARPYVRDDMPVYAVTTFARGLPFYLRRTITLADQRPYDLRAGMQWEPGLSIPDLDAFARAWRAHPDAVALMPARSFRTLTTSGVPMRVVAAMGDNLVVRNPAVEPTRREPHPATGR
jgi:4-amino-4-deoxy-L-arabinose transferase-like glycosyltransferase